jgi:hypothetical protein
MKILYFFINFLKMNVSKVSIDKIVKAFELEENLKENVDFCVGRAGAQGLWNFILTNPQGDDPKIFILSENDPEIIKLCQKHNLL